MKAVYLQHAEGKPGKVFYPLKLVEVPKPECKPDELLIRLTHASLNHRDLFIRQNLYPAVSFSVPLLSDGSGVVVAAGSSLLSERWKNKRVVVNPGQGWESDPAGPEGSFAIVGGTKQTTAGTLQEYIAVKAEDVIELPPHLSPAEGSAFALAGLTAWRALFTKSGNAKPGRNMLVTGIGGGVALNLLLFGEAAGCNVFVTSGSQEKLDKAKKLGAQGGVIYKGANWEKQLLEQLPTERKYIDAIIDGAGLNIVEKGCKLLKVGGVIVSYGMTTGPQLPYPMSAVLKQIELRGSTMGSRAEFRAMFEQVRIKMLRPSISRVLDTSIDDLEGINGLYEDMKSASQVGKLVLRIADDEERSRL